ncbi:dihydroorotase (ISS) [Dorcoceras hygrometricum]|uniref:Dihydroorotase (ISS) n=1 Tax=Dorcoceras hygrometricum TaxID=472368 RepID=A0A2Z7C7L8_9LAMI|nr:dihydroorotase (ISS) [Dorcoceras hygrometricum]
MMAAEHKAPDCAEEMRSELLVIGIEKNKSVTCLQEHIVTISLAWFLTRAMLPGVAATIYKGILCTIAPLMLSLNALMEKLISQLFCKTPVLCRQQYEDADLVCLMIAEENLKCWFYQVSSSPGTVRIRAYERTISLEVLTERVRSERNFETVQEHNGVYGASYIKSEG